MKLLWRMGKDAIRYKSLYVIAIFSTLALTVINLAAPKLLSNMIQVVENGEKDAGRTIRLLTLALVGIYLIRILFRYLSNYLSHKAAWNLVEDHRIRVIRPHTGFAIAHRLSTFQNADLILVLQEGRIVQRGTHEELMAREDLYQRLIRLQNHASQG